MIKPAETRLEQRKRQRINRRHDANHGTGYGRHAMFASGYETKANTRTRRYKSRTQPTAEFAEASEHRRTEIRESLRDLDRNNTIFQRILNVGEENIIGLGPRVTPMTADRSWNDAALEIYEARCASSEFTPSRQMSEWEASRLVWRSRERDGGVIVYHPFGRTQMFEDGQIVTPLKLKDRDSVRHGIQYDGAEVSGYWVGPYNKHGYVDVAEAFFLPAWHVDEDLQVRLPITQYLHHTNFLSGDRALSPLAAVPEHLERLDDYTEAVLERAIQESSIMGALFSDDTDAHESINVGRTDDNPSAGPESAYDKISYIEPGIVPHFKKDDRFEMHAPTTPNKEASPFMKMVVRLAAVTRAQPIELTLMEFSESNFSASRAAIEQAKRLWLMEHKYLKLNWYRVNYLWSTYEAILAGDLTFRDDWQRLTVSPPGWRYLQPKEDAEANEIRMRSGEANLTEVLSEQGKSRKEFYRTTADEILEAQEVAAETGVDVNLLLKHAAAKAAQPTEAA